MSKYEHVQSFKPVVHNLSIGLKVQNNGSKRILNTTLNYDTVFLCV